MKTIGIITYHHYYNYGTMLQAMALQKAIEKLDYDAELIDFKQDNTLSKFDLFCVRIKRIPVYLRNIKKYIGLNSVKQRFDYRNLQFEEFYKKNLIVSLKKYRTSDELCMDPPQYDGYIVGSDQTWNPNVGRNPEAFYLTFVKERKRRGSYAPSIGLSNFSLEEKLRLKPLLDGINYLSCREHQGAELISELTGRSVKTVLDPTFLLESNEWDEYSDDNNQNIKERYILQYFLGDVIECRDFVEKLSEVTGLKVIVLPHSYLDITKENCVYCSPANFISLVKNADYICTDSFHGTAFSINYNKNFFAFHKRKNSETGSDNSRITDILHRLNLDNRLITDYCLPSELNIDYNIINKKLVTLRKDSAIYLKNMLQSITEIGL